MYVLFHSTHYAHYCTTAPVGTEEGAFAWLTLNYLLGNLGKAPSSTVAAIDLGGGSVQQAFALPPDAAQAAPQVGGCSL